MKILMVCLGNICRSPIAEGVLRDMIEKQDLDWTVDSAGTSSYHNGDAPHLDSQAVCMTHHIDISSQRSGLFIPRDLQDFDLIIAMDQQNYNDIVSQTQSAEERDRVRLLLDYSHPGEGRSVPDPYYEGGFDRVYAMIEQACSSLIKTHYK